jgi:tRNA(Ile)-lysidine synthase
MRSRAIERVRRAVRSAAIRLPDVLAHGTRLVVGFSGGQDSTCLLHALASSHRHLDLLAVHVDHALRADSQVAAQEVQRRAEAMGVTCEVMRVDVAAYRAGLEKRTSVQQAARAARYQALALAAERHAAAAVLVAHTADDQAETVLLNLVRGTGVLGLAGMRVDDVLDPTRFGPPAFEPQPRQPVRLVRPLLRLPRPTTLAYCTDSGLSLVEDASNQTRAFTRNRVRLDVLPLLEQFNPAIREVLARTADLAADDLAVLERLVADLRAAIQRDGEYDLATFRAQPRGLQRRLLRDVLRSASGQLIDVADSTVEDALDLLQTGQPNQTYALPYGVEVCIKKQTFVLQRGDRTRPRQPDKIWETVVTRV